MEERRVGDNRIKGAAAVVNRKGKEEWERNEGEGEDKIREGNTWATGKSKQERKVWRAGKEEIEKKRKVQCRIAVQTGEQCLWADEKTRKKKTSGRNGRNREKIKEKKENLTNCGCNVNCRPL